MELKEQQKELQDVKVECILKKSSYPLVQWLMTKYPFISSEKGDDVYYYNDGIYEDADMLISNTSEKVLDVSCTNNKTNEVRGHITRSTGRKDEEIYDNPNPYLICLQNGILNVQTLEVTPHTPKLFFLNRVPANYDPLAECPNFEKFMSEIVSKEDVDKLQEYVGYCLYRSMPFHKALMLVGTGSNGKSTFIHILTQFLGSHNVSEIPLQSLETNKFAPAELHGKLVNVFADIPSESMKSTSYFKILVSGDSITAERKFKNPFRFANTAKMIFSANQVPISYDDSDAFYRRWEIVTFPTTFQKGTVDALIKEKIINPQEISGILNWALKGLKRLLETQTFTGSQTTEEVRARYSQLSDSVKAFQMDCLEFDNESWVTKQELYQIYTEYCRNKRFISLNYDSFHRRLQKLINIEDYRPQIIKGNRPSAWKGIRVNHDNLASTFQMSKVDAKNTNLFVNSTTITNMSTMSTFIPIEKRSNNIYIIRSKVDGRNFSPKIDINNKKMVDMVDMVDENGLKTGCCPENVNLDGFVMVDARMVSQLTLDPVRCKICSLNHCHYTHGVTGSPYCYLCANDVVTKGELAK